MEFFHKAKAIRLKSSYNKYLVAQAESESVRQDKNGSGKTASWTVELSDDGSCIRLKSCFGKYLTASEEAFLLGMTGNKVIQTSHSIVLDNSTYWKPIKHGSKVRLETSNEGFLRGTGGLPPWRNAVTHANTFMGYETIWEVDVLELQVTPKSTSSLLSDSIPNGLINIRQIALAFYTNCSNDDRSAAVKMFRKADSDGNGDLSYQEFHAACLEQKCPEIFLQETFNDLDLDKNGALDFEEAITLYYMLTHRMLFCESCKQYLHDSYFNCATCFFQQKNPKIFKVCVTCYQGQRFDHAHNEFVDNHTLINMAALKKGITSDDSGSWFWTVAEFGATAAVSNGVCNIM